MNEILAALTTLLPPKRKTTPTGWVSFNSVCCHHRGESRDDRMRGGILINAQNGFQYHCFNCHFKAGWTVGRLLTANTRLLFNWLGLGESDISKLGMVAMRLRENIPRVARTLNFTLEQRPLPEDCLPIDQWLEHGCQDQDLINVVSYLMDQRQVEWNWYPWHWSSSTGYRDRVIIPFYQNGMIVGWTGRKITDGKPKYLTDTQPGYVFNLDRQIYDRAYVIVVEGQFDAIAIDGVAVMRNDINDTQAARITALGKEVIVVPDRDQPGANLIKSALAHNWGVSMPPWEDDIKDVADAVKRYGRLYTLYSILHYRETNEVKIQLLKKKLENIQDEQS